MDSDAYAPVEDITLSKFSQTWVCLGYAIPLYLSLFIKDMSLLTKLAGVGVYAIYSYIIFIFYAFFSTIN